MNITKKKYNNWKQKKRAISFLKKINTYHLYKNELLVDLSHKKITDFPEEILYLDEIDIINLRNNEVRLLPPPEKFKNIKNLRKIQIGSNPMSIMEFSKTIRDFKEYKVIVEY